MSFCRGFFHIVFIVASGIVNRSQASCDQNVFEKANVQFKELGTLGDYKIEVGKPTAPSEHPELQRDPAWVRTTQIKSPEKQIVQNLGCTHHERKFEIRSKKLVLIETAYDRYGPDYSVTTTNYELDTAGHFTKGSVDTRYPYAELRDRFATGLKRKDLPTILEIRPQLLKSWSNTYNPDFFYKERRRACFDSLKVGYEKASVNSDAQKAAKVILPLLGEKNGCSSIYSLDKDENTASEIALINNVAFRMQKGGASTEARDLLRGVLLAQPNRSVAYLNLADTFEGLNKPGVAVLARTTAAVLKAKRKTLTATEVSSIRQFYKMECTSEKIAATLSDNVGTLRLAMTCGADTEPFLEWHSDWDDPIFASTMTVPSQCPLTKVESNPRKAIWSDLKDSPSIDSGLRTILRSCEKIVGAVQLQECRWTAACGGGVDYKAVPEESSIESIVDFVEVNEMRKSARVIARSSAMLIEPVVEPFGFKVNESMIFNTKSGSQKISIGHWLFTCEGKTCTPKYECQKLPVLDFPIISFQPVGEDWPQFDSLGLYAFLRESDKKQTIVAGKHYPYLEFYQPGVPNLVLDLSAVRANHSACY